MRAAAALICGLLFGLGLAWSGMTDPARVIAFLDIGGDWDGRLALVMGSALLLAAPVYAVVLRRRRALLDNRLHLPERSLIDRDLLGGAVLFGVGWGIAGFCPGPAIAALAGGDGEVVVFVLAMALGMALRQLQVRALATREDCRS